MKQMMKRLLHPFKTILILGAIFLSGCSLTNRFKKTGLFINKPVFFFENSKSYVAHIDHLYKGFHHQNLNKIKPVRGRKKDYLDQLVNSLYPETKKVEFYKIESTKPVFFSLLGEEFIFQKKLIKNYIDSEVLLKTLLVEILLRVNFTVYQRTELSPTGYVNEQIIAALQRLPVVQRVNLDKWIFDHLKKNDLPGEIVLDWIQIKNRNFQRVFLLSFR